MFLFSFGSMGHRFRLPLLGVIAGVTSASFSLQVRAAPRPQDAPQVHAAKEAVVDLKKRFSDNQVEIAKLRKLIKHQKLLNQNDRVISVGSMSLDNIEVANQLKKIGEIRQQIAELKKERLPEMNDQRLAALASRIQSLQQQIDNQLSLKKPERIKLNQALIDAKTQHRRHKEALFADAPDFKQLEVKLLLAQEQLRELRIRHRPDESAGVAAVDMAALNMRSELQALTDESAEIHEQIKQAQLAYEAAYVAAANRYADHQRAQAERRERERNWRFNRRRYRNYINRFR